MFHWGQSNLFIAIPGESRRVRPGIQDCFGHEAPGRTYAATIAGIPDNFELPPAPSTGVCLVPRGIPRCRRPLEKGAINDLVSKSPF
jgi:hypothetical protein